MKRKWIISLLIILGIVISILLVLLLSSYLDYRALRIDNKYEVVVYDNLLAIAEADTTFDLNNVTPFEWDTMHVYPPYTPKELMVEEQGMNWTREPFFYRYLFQKALKMDGTLLHDGYHTLVFTYDNKVILDLTLNRSDLDFTQVRQVIESNNAQLVIKQSKYNFLIVNKSDN